MALVSKTPQLIEVSNNTYVKVGYIWLELSIFRADKVNVNGKLFLNKDQMSDNLPQMYQTKYFGEMDGTIFDKDLGDKAHAFVKEQLKDFEIE